MQVYVFQGIKGYRSMFIVEAETEAEARDKLLNKGEYIEDRLPSKTVVRDIELTRIDNLELRDCPYCGEETHFVVVNNNSCFGYSVACSTEGCFCYAGTFSNEIRKCYPTCKEAAAAWNVVPPKKKRSKNG